MSTRQAIVDYCEKHGIKVPKSFHDLETIYGIALIDARVPQAHRLVDETFYSVSSLLQHLLDQNWHPGNYQVLDFKRRAELVWEHPASLARGANLSQGSFAAVERWLGERLSPQLVKTLTDLGGRSLGDHVEFYGPDEIIERNECYKSKINCPGWLAIADYTAGRAVVVSPSPSFRTVFLADRRSMLPESFARVADDLSAWIQAGCPTFAGA